METATRLQRIQGKPKRRLRQAAAALLLLLAGLGLLKYTGEHASAAELFRRVIDRWTEVYGAGHPNTVQALHDLAQALQDLGELDQAESTFREALALRQSLQPADTVATAQTLNGLTALLLLRGELESAEALFRQALGLRREALGEVHPLIAESLGNVALVLTHKRKHAEAVPILEEALALDRPQGPGRSTTPTWRPCSTTSAPPTTPSGTSRKRCASTSLRSRSANSGWSNRVPSWRA